MSIAVSIITILFLGFGQHHADANEIISILKTNCSAFATLKEAEAYVALHPQLEKRLDRDHDGQICEAKK